uniref:Hypothetical cob intron 4-like protein n=1 Tax=Penaeus monodon TaxID=6687 RepID=Q8MWB6_PENMO|nr:hypothetical cob intron 4-like protein [Penaeus monodon]
MNENEYLHNTRDVFGRFRLYHRQKNMYFRRRYNRSCIVKILILIHNFFYICQHEYGCTG